MAIVRCTRCGNEKEAVKNTAFYGGEIGDTLKKSACQDCWNEWIRMQTMIINEYRLNLMDPKSDELLNAQVLAFFKLSESGEVAAVNYVPPAET